VTQIKNLGYLVAAFTVNQPRRARELIGRGVDCLISDAPQRIEAALVTAGRGGRSAAVAKVGR
jgi:glycerophosphoryl diester phosphodiesterase